jgi:hypothetical protein
VAQVWEGEPSEHSHEQEGLNHIRAHLDERGIPYYARQCFTFTSSSGRVRECDLLLAVPSGFYLLELKAHPGHLVNRGDLWTFERRKSIRNPLHLTDQKAKELKGNLERVSRGQPVPFLQAAVFLSAADLVSELDQFQCQNVYGREDREADTELPGIVSRLLDRTPNPRRRTPNAFYNLLHTLLRVIGGGGKTKQQRGQADAQTPRRARRSSPRAPRAGRSWPGWSRR